jgi:ribose transport system permease protein
MACATRFHQVMIEGGRVDRKSFVDGTGITDDGSASMSSRGVSIGGPRRAWVFAAAHLRTSGILLALSLLIAIVDIADPSFLSVANIFNMLGQWALAGVMAVGMTFVIIAGGFDLSIASGFSLCAIVAALLGADGYPLAVAMLGALATGLVVGGVNGALVAFFGINPFIATVGSGFILLGIDFLATPSTYIRVDQAGFDALGAGSWLLFPFRGMILLAFLVLGEAVLAKTVYGRYVYAVGANATVSRLSGLPVGLIVASTYVVSGLCMGVAGGLAASQLGTAQARMEPTIVYDVLAAVVIGGTSLSGGAGAMWRTAAGLAILATISNGFTLVGLNPLHQGIVKGGIIILALALDSWTSQLPRFRPG